MGWLAGALLAEAMRLAIAGHDLLTEALLVAPSWPPQAAMPMPTRGPTKQADPASAVFAHHRRLLFFILGLHRECCACSPTL